MKTIIETAISAGQYTTLLAMLKAGALSDTLRLPGPYTVFAPTDEAFKKLSPRAVAAMIKDVRRLKVVLTQHIVCGRFDVEQLLAGAVKSVAGTMLVAVRSGDQIIVNGATILTGDIAVTNGVLHSVDAMVLPKSVELASVA